MPVFLDILYETPHWLAVNKPGGLIVENNPFESPTVESLVFDYLEKAKPKPFLGIVHRLDRVTSGVMVFAKKKSALRHLNEQFAQRKVRKTYLAVVANAPENSTGVLKNWLVKDQKNKKALIFDTAQKGGQEVQLEYRILAKEDQQTLLEVQPLTGKFHQIRAQLAAIDCPILGDEKYGSAFHPNRKNIALHAWKLEVFDPQNNQKKFLTALPPEDLFWNPFSKNL